MLEVVIEIDGRPLSTFGCDGVVVSTPTGSTAYNFSAGGPVIWPTVEAIAVVPLSAHALFAKPLVVGPEHAVAIELLQRTTGAGVLWCDGRRSLDLPPGARVVVRRSERPVRLARLHPAAFTDRLVRKFRLPVDGWRGPCAADRTGRSARPVIEEMRLRDLGVIAEATLPMGPGFTAITGETGAGKTMVVTGLGLLLGQRADSGAVRSGAAQASVDGVWIVPADGVVVDRVREAGGDVEPLGDGRAELVLGRTISSEGRSRATVGGRSAPAACSPISPTSSSSCTASPSSSGCAPRQRSATRSTVSAARPCRPRSRRTAPPSSAAARSTASSTTLTTDRDARAREAERAARGDRRDRAGGAAAGRGCRARRAGRAPRERRRAAARRGDRPRSALRRR